MRVLWAGLACAALAGCSASAPTAGARPTASVDFRPDAQGLAVSGTTKRVDFGRSPRGVIPLMDREERRHVDLGLGGCPSGIAQQLQWGDLVLTFSQDRFVGWKTSEGQAGQTCV